MPHALTSHFQYYLSLRYRFNTKQAKNKEKIYTNICIQTKYCIYIYIYIFAHEACEKTYK